MKFSCQFECPYKSINYKWLIQHMWNFHSMQGNFSVKCNISGCPAKFTNQKCFMRHIRAKHKDFQNKFLKEYVPADESLNTSNDVVSQSVEDDDPYDTETQEMEIDFGNVNDNNSDVEDETDVLFEPFSSISVDDEVADVLIELREVHNVTQSAISSICNKIISILQTDRISQKKKITKSLKENHPDFIIDYETNLILDSDSPFKRPFQRFANGQTLNNFISQKEHYIAPSEIPLGIDPDTGVNESVYYIPILKTLERYLNHSDVLGDMDNTSSSDDKIIRDFKDSSNFKSNLLYECHPNALQIVFYHDDFTVSNPLGNKTSKFKISGFYFLVGKNKK